jgi:hypothetical protein
MPIGINSVTIILQFLKNHPIQVVINNEAILKIYSQFLRLYYPGCSQFTFLNVAERSWS